MITLLYLVVYERHEGMGARAWKGFDWETLNRLHEKGYILNPIGKAKSVEMTEEGFLKAEELFEKHFAIKLKGQGRLDMIKIADWQVVLSEVTL